MRLFYAYIKQRRRGLLALLLFCALFFATFYLYRLPLKAVMYPTLLCALLGLLFIAVDFSRVKRRHRRLHDVKELTASMIASIPEIDSVEDADYQAIIQALQSEIADLKTLTSNRYRNMVEYYTVWAHQIKTPIASMQLTLQNEDSELSRRLSSDLFRIEQYVEMVLAFLRLDSTSSDYVFREYSIDDIVKEAVSKFASEFTHKKLRLIYEPMEETVITDDKWLSFVVEQILSNALKYTRSGSIKVYMREPKTLCIEDTGIGIAPEDLPRIFEKGYTGYNGRRDKKASGIGLYLCQRICRNLGIGITVDSEPDRGTVVMLALTQYDLKTE